MLAQTTEDLNFVAFFSRAGAGAVGLTVTCTVYDPTGSAVVSGVSATAIAGGLYRYTLIGADVSLAGAYTAIFHTTDITVDAVDVPSLWVVAQPWVTALALASVVSAILDGILTGHTIAHSVAVALNDASLAGNFGRVVVPGDFAIGTAGYNIGLMSSGQVTIISPLSMNGRRLDLIPGMAYQVERGTGLAWTLPTGAPDLDAVPSLVLEVGHPRHPIFQVNCTHDRDLAGAQHVYAELTSALTALLPDAGSTCAFAVWARWSDSDTDAIPVVSGVCNTAKALP